MTPTQSAAAEMYLAQPAEVRALAEHTALECETCRIASKAPIPPPPVTVGQILGGYCLVGQQLWLKRIAMELGMRARDAVK